MAPSRRSRRCFDSVIDAEGSAGGDLGHDGFALDGAAGGATGSAAALTPVHGDGEEAVLPEPDGVAAPSGSTPPTLASPPDAPPPPPAPLGHLRATSRAAVVEVPEISRSLRNLKDLRWGSFRFSRKSAELA